MGEVKGIRISYNMGKHDIAIRTKQTSKFLEKGNKALFIAKNSRFLTKFTIFY